MLTKPATVWVHAIDSTLSDVRFIYLSQNGNWNSFSTL